MSNQTNSAVCGLRTTCDLLFTPFQEFIEICPPDLWTKNFGGWPIWQHVYHTLAVVAIVATKSGQPAITLPLPMDVVDLLQTPSEPLSQMQTKAFAKEARGSLEALFDRLSDADLGLVNDDFSKYFGQEMSQCAALGMVSAHISYHLGICDSILREHGLQGLV